jgi:RNA ligase
MHPARRLSFDALFDALESRVAAGAVARADEGRLRLYIYSNRCVYERLWDDVSVLARGLVLDREARVVRATPFPKFFNHGEMAAPIPDEPFVADEKMDGSLAILFHDGDRWRVVTKGSFDSP